MKLTPEEHPLHAWYPLFMLLFLVVIVVGLFLDRRSHSDTSNNEHVLRLYFDEDVDLAQMQSTVAKCNSSRRGDLDDESKFMARIHIDAGGALVSLARKIHEKGCSDIQVAL